MADRITQEDLLIVLQQSAAPSTKLKIEVLDGEQKIIDILQCGLTGGNMSISGESDIRRTAGFVKTAYYGLIRTSGCPSACITPERGNINIIRWDTMFIPIPPDHMTPLPTALPSIAPTLPRSWTEPNISFEPQIRFS